MKIKEMSIASKIAACLGIVVFCILLGSTVLMAFFKAANIDLSDLSSLSNLDITTQQLRTIKIGFGLNHLISFVLSGLILALVFSRNRFVDYTGLKIQINLSLLGSLLILLILTYPLSAFLISLIQQMDLPSWASQMDAQSLEALSKLLKMDTSLDYVINLIVIALFAGVGEELLFRGVIQKEISKYLPPKTSIFIAALIFALVHLEFTGLLPKLLIGLVLGYSYYLSKNLLVPIIIHTLNNGLQVSLLYFGQDQIQSMSDTSNDEKIMWGGLIFLPLVFIYFKHLHNKFDGVNA